MKTVTTSKGTFLLVEVPEGAEGFNLARPLGNLTLHFKSRGYPSIIPIPEANYSTIGKASELTELDWKGIIPPKWTMVGGTYMPYEVFENGNKIFKTATNAAKSLIKSLNMKWNQTLILKQE